MEAVLKAPRAIQWERTAGRVVSGLAVAFFVMDAGFKLAAPQMAIDNSPPLGWPADVQSYRMLGLILLVPTMLYVLPRTAVLGALLLTAYLGGAVALHVRVGSPLFSHILFGVYLGVFVWGGLWLRDPRIRALLPLRAIERETDHVR
jgi:hypothetical protein